MEAISASDLLISVLFLVIGTLLLYFGAEGLVSGSASVAVRAGIRPLVAGLTVVAFGTSSPELIVSISAAMSGNSEIALGNVIGSNICNIALIIGIAAFIRPITIDMKLIKRDMGIMIFSSVLLLVLLIDGEIGRFDGIILALGIIIYIIMTLYIARKEKDDSIREMYAGDIPKKPRKTSVDILMIILGMSGLVFGANLFLDGAIDIADYLGAPKAIVGLSIVAFGTSLPELATSMVASLKKEGDISIGNAIGSNIFNILCVLGFVSIIHPISSQNISIWDLGVMMFVAVIILPIALTGLRVSRLEGVFLLIIYTAYIFYLYHQLPTI